MQVMLDLSQRNLLDGYRDTVSALLEYTGEDGAAVVASFERDFPDAPQRYDDDDDYVEAMSYVVEELEALAYDNGYIACADEGWYMIGTPEDWEEYDVA